MHERLIGKIYFQYWTSPRSLEVCKMLGINPNNLIYKGIKVFKLENSNWDLTKK